MIFEQLPVAGAYLIRMSSNGDDRGSFTRLFCKKQFEAANLHSEYVQISVSKNIHTGTLRGLHYQLEPSAEVKLVYCSRGKIFDVIVDIRERSPTFGKWAGIYLRETVMEALYIPAGFAHGYITMELNSELIYMISNYHHPQLSRTLAWDDPTVNIRWPIPPILISDRDKNGVLFSELYS